LRDILRATVLYELEILDEPCRQRLTLAIVVLAAGPGTRRIENLRRNAFEFERDIESEDRVSPVCHPIQLTG
jgi:hypothetical protein